MRLGISPRFAGAAWLVVAVLGCMTESASVPVAHDQRASIAGRTAEIEKLGVERATDIASIGVSLPKTADDAVELAPPGRSTGVRFTLLGAASIAPASDGGMSLYRGALDGADLAHVILRDGVEDLVFFDRAPAREELVYRIDVSRVAGLRLVRGSLELLDERGAPQVRVDRPWLADAAGKRHWLDLSIEGCAVDRSELAPFGRKVTPPGASSCRMAVAWRDVSYPAVVDPAWRLASSMGARYGFQTFTYANGRVIACGGHLSCAGMCGNGSVDDCTFFDPVARTWAAGPGLPTGREEGAVAALPSGRAYFVGGSTGSSRPELISSTGAVTRPMDAIFAAGAGVAATALASGKVLVTGGGSANAALFDEPAEAYTTAGTSPVGAMKVARSFHTTTRLASGKILIAGGGPASAEIYDPAANTFTLVAAPMNVARQGHVAATLPDGRVLLAFGGSATAEIYDPVASTFTPTAAAVSDRDRASVVTLDSGDIMILGGESGGPIGRVEIFDVVTKTFSAQPLLSFARTRFGAAKIAPPAGAKGEVAAFGGLGTSGYSLSSTEIWGPGAAGSTCTTGDDCRSGDCQEGICCAVSCSTTCKTCVPSTGACVQTLKADDPSTCTGPNTCDGVGACKKKNGQTCGAPAECASGFCVDGACCDRACNGQCEACNVPGVVGSCAPIAGTPRGGRPACNAVGTTCGGTCNGADGVTCAYPGAVTTCGSACAGDKLTLSTCDGRGTCTIDVARSCAGNFICADDKVCKTTCATSADCATGYQCITGRCLPIALCEDHFVTKGESKIDCFPYTCEQTGNCRTSCASVADCVAPTLCSLDGQCVDPPPPPESGCTVARTIGGRGEGGSAVLLFAVAVVVLLAARARRFTLGLVVAAGATLGCTSTRDDRADSRPDTAATTAAAGSELAALRARFPGLLSRPDGDGTWSSSGLSVDLPSDLRGDLVVRHASSGIAVHARAIDERRTTRSPRVEVDGISVFAGAGVVMRRSRFGVEDFVFLAERPREGEVRYALALEGVSGLRLVGGSLELLDADGTPRIRMAAPYAIDATGTRNPATVDLDGCAFDTSPAGPWGRPVTPPGSEQCTLRIRLGAMTYPALLDPAWVTTGSMSPARDSHAAVKLANGKVLVMYGETCQSGCLLASSSGVLYDPTTKTFSGTGAASGKVSNTSAVLLGNGKALVMGPPPDGAWLYDAGLGTFSPAGASAVMRSGGSTLTLLTSGKVLAVGGGAGSEIYDAGANSFTAGPAPKAARSTHTATLLANGKVLLTGGGTASAELYDPAGAGSFTLTGSMSVARTGHSAVRLASGKVLVVGSDSKDGEVYDPATGVFTKTKGAMAEVRDGSVATLLRSGNVYVTGGFINNVATQIVERYEPATDTFTVAPFLLAGRGFHRATLLDSGTLLVTGGRDLKASGSSSDIEEAEELGVTAPGAVCVIDDDCSSGSCDQGVCCAGACTATCRSCVAGTGACQLVSNADDPSSCKGDNTCDATGACKKKRGRACAGPIDCASGFCVDGVCCDRACSGTCEACDGPTPGTCTTIPGKPHGTRACATDGTACGGACSGTVADRCTFPDATTGCGASCADGVRNAGACDTKGACILQGPRPCPGNYACLDDKACRTTCSTNAECARGYGCEAAKCIPIAYCDGQQTIIGVDGKSKTDCAPFTCDTSTNRCRVTCEDVNGCAPPFFCNVAGECVAPPSAPSGCAVTTTADLGGDARDPIRTTGAVLVGAALVFLRARRRRNCSLAARRPLDRL